jgi:cyclopropane fatty-acyl-phospholipid synthase-like methyltransferase
MSILCRLFKTKKDNTAWESDKPTPYVIDCLNDGLIKKSDSVIDIGCGFGRNSNWLATQGIDVTAINIDKQEITHAKNRAKELVVTLNYILSDFLKYDNKGKLFDVALDLGCSHMLSTPDQYLFEKKAATMVKTGGLLIYFGFSKNHPAYNPDSKRAIYRNSEDLLKIYGKDFEILSQKEYSWIPSPDENSNFPKHVGLNVVMRRK